MPKWRRAISSGIREVRYGSLSYTPFIEPKLKFLPKHSIRRKEYLTRKELALERDRLLVLHEITNALVSKLSSDELFAAISGQLYRIIPHSTKTSRTSKENQ